MSIKFEKANIADLIWVISELEHVQKHALRSMLSSETTDEDKVWYAVIAKQAKNIRRKFMDNHFPECPDELWCLGKASASLRQLAYESFVGEMEELDEIDNLVDEIWGKITGEDMSNCKACRDDKEQKEEA